MEVENYPTRDHHHPHHLSSQLNIHHHHKIISSSSTKDLTFEIKVTYMRIISSSITNIVNKTSTSTSSMNLVYLPRDLQTCLQINGLKITPSEKISRPLNKHRSGSIMSELMYVNTDIIKFKGFSLPFEIVFQDASSTTSSSSSVLVSGSLRRKVSGMKDDCMWVMESKELSHDSKFTNGGGGSVDVYFAGRSLGEPLLLNGLVELKKSHKGLDFVEDEYQDGGELGLLDTSKEKVGEKSIQEYVGAHKYNSKHDHDQDQNKNNYGEEEKFVVEEEEEEVSWFNEGVRVGIGLGMGMCVLGVGVGLGLIVKTYKKTSGSFKKFLF